MLDPNSVSMIVLVSDGDPTVGKDPTLGEKKGRWDWPEKSVQHVDTLTVSLKTDVSLSSNACAVLLQSAIGAMGLCIKAFKK